MLKHWTNYRDETDRPVELDHSNLEDELQEFAGYLLSLGSVGGGSVLSYVSLLPAALAKQSGLTSPSFRIPRSIRTAVERIAREVPQTYSFERGPATLPVVRTIAADNSISYAVRAAIVVQYHSGFRGINVYITKKGSKRRALHWGDCVARGNGVDRSWTIRVRMEKTAKKHTGTFPDKVLAVPLEPSTPCPVTALDKMWSLRSSTDPNDCVFPAVDYKKVSAALKKHEPPGVKLSPHSIRIGAASDVRDAGLPERSVQQKGNWRVPQSANTYLHGSVKATQAEMSAVAKATLGTQHAAPMGPHETSAKPASAAAAAATPAATDYAGGDAAAAAVVAAQAITPASGTQTHREPSFSQLHGRIYTNAVDDVVLLLRKASAERLWAYFYDPVSHERVLRPRSSGRKHLGHYELIHTTEVGHLLKFSKILDGQLTSDLAADAAHVRSKPMSSSALADRKNPRTRGRGL